MHVHRSLALYAVLALTAGALLPAPGRAELLFNVSLDTALLIGHPAGPFYINFQLNDGGGAGNANNTAVVTNFVFGTGGGPAGSPFLVGGASGSLSSSVTITDSSFFNSFIQEFTPGDLLSFDVHLTTNGEAGPIPDEFSFAILDHTLVELPTLGPADALLLVNIKASGTTIETFGGDPDRSPNWGGDPIPLPAAAAQVVPEPATLTLLVVGMGLLAAVRSGKRLLLLTRVT